MVTVEEALEELRSLEDEGERAMNLYARFGLTVYHIQVFEQITVNMLALPRMHDGSILTQEQADEMWESFDRDKKTLGTLIREVRNYYNFSEEVEAKLTEVLHQRNFIVHSYFKHNDKLFFSTDGQERIVRDMTSFSILLKETEALLMPYISRSMEILGLTPEKIERAVEEMRDEGKEIDFSRYISIKPKD